MILSIFYLLITKLLFYQAIQFIVQSKQTMNTLIFGLLLVTVTFACDFSCQTCNKTECLTCFQGYFLKDNNCSKCQDNCIHCSSESSCSSCTQNYYLQSQKCNSCFTSCQICTNAVTCDKCFNSYYLSASSACLPCGRLCASCTDNSSCSSCIYGHYLQNGICTQCGQNCKQCSDNSGCSGCHTGYYSLNGECQSCSPFCQSCISDTECTSCQYQYYLSNNVCTSCLACANIPLCINQGQCIPIRQDKKESATPKSFLLYVLVPIIGTIVFFMIAYAIVSKATKQSLPGSFPSKETIPTSTTNIQTTTTIIEENKEGGFEQMEEKLDPQIKIDTL